MGSPLGIVSARVERSSTMGGNAGWPLRPDGVERGVLRRMTLQPALTAEFTASAGWLGLSAPARGVLRGVLELAFRRDGGWSVDSTPKEMSQWFGRELSMPPATILEVLRELEGAGYLCKGRSAVGCRFVVRAPVEAR